MNSHLSDADRGQACNLKEKIRDCLNQRWCTKNIKQSHIKLECPSSLSIVQSTQVKIEICVHHIHSTQVEMRKARTYLQQCAVSFSTPKKIFTPKKKKKYSQKKIFTQIIFTQKIVRLSFVDLRWAQLYVSLVRFKHCYILSDTIS